MRAIRVHYRTTERSWTQITDYDGTLTAEQAQEIVTQQRADDPRVESTEVLDVQVIDDEVEAAIAAFDAACESGIV